ncbi:MAG: uroporphyrinogen-III C-methyltransferase [Planctomycetes bacterium]|nr:uroporphyrinogen-III C-methyltransferase [Planctomycetota bacterium]
MNEQTGIVTLVGAGPGDPDLLTVGGLRALQRADVVVHDNLVCPDMLALAVHATLIDVGKLPFGQRTEQETINSILVREGSVGRNVVRLKGGDPFMFGRGTEEIAALHRAGIPFRVIPGVSSLNGVLGAAGVAPTVRGRNHGFAVFSGAGVTDEREFEQWALTPGPAIVFMGVHRAAQIATAFIEQGRPQDTPVVVVARGGSPAELIAETTLDQLGALLADASAWTPAIIAIGVAREHAFKARPLDGKVAVMAAGALDTPEGDLLRALGARLACVDPSGQPAHPLARSVPLAVPERRVS